VCARCTGLYVGFWLGLILVPNWTALRNKLAGRPRLILLFMIPMGLDLLLQNTHWTRLFSGALAAFPIAVFVWWGVEQISFPLFKRSLS
jgi:uncharacterized membrane protein